MNLFKFLKSTSGKIVMGVPQLLAIGGTGAMLVYGAYQADNTFASTERPLRSVSSIISSSPQEGMRHRNGLLTSINIKDSLNQVATAAERETMEAGSGAANNFGLDNVDSIQNISFGPAAATSATDGLGMGANKAVENAPAAGNAPAGSVAGVNSGAVASAARRRGAGSQDEGDRPTLGTASMARASGNAFNAAAGTMSGSSDGSAARRTAVAGGRGGGSTSSGASSEGYQFSGAMPSGSNAVSAMGLSRPSNSTFMAGGRNSTSAGVRRSFKEKNDLKDISKRSAEAAANRDRSANEGSRALLASYKNSGGMTVEGNASTEDNSAGSADFSAPEASQLKAVGDWAQEEDDFAEKQEKARKRLMWMTLALVAVTVVAIPAGYHLISKGKMLMATPVTAAAGASMVAWGWVILGVVMAYALTVAGFGIHYQRNYNGLFMPIMSYVVALGAIAAMIMTGLSAMKVGVKGDTVAKEAFMKKAIGAVKTVGITSATAGGETLVQQLQQKDAQAAQQQASKK